LPGEAEYSNANDPVCLDSNEKGAAGVPLQPHRSGGLRDKTLSCLGGREIQQMIREPFGPKGLGDHPCNGIDFFRPRFADSNRVSLLLGARDSLRFGRQLPRTVIPPGSALPNALRALGDRCA
jgi:hypothetical protein